MTDLSASLTTQSGRSGFLRRLVYLKPSAFFLVLGAGQQSLLGSFKAERKDCFAHDAMNFG